MQTVCQGGHFDAPSSQLTSEGIQSSVDRFDRQSSMPYFLYERTMAASQSAIANSSTSVRQLQTGVGTRQQKDKELARPTKNGLKICISCLRQFWPVFVVEL